MSQSKAEYSRYSSQNTVWRYFQYPRSFGRLHRFAILYALHPTNWTSLTQPTPPLHNLDQWFMRLMPNIQTFGRNIDILLTFIEYITHKHTHTYKTHTYFQSKLHANSLNGLKESKMTDFCICSTT